VIASLLMFYLTSLNTVALYFKVYSVLVVKGNYTWVKVRFRFRFRVST